MHFVDAHVHGADVRMHGADVHGADVRGSREVLVGSLIPVGLWCSPTEVVSYNGRTM